MKNMNAINEMSREDRVALRRSYEENVSALEEIYSRTDKPAETIRELVKEIGCRPALLTIASMVNNKAWDGRISRNTAIWAANIEDSLDEEAAREIGCYSNRIHPAHLDQLASAMAAYSPLDEWTSEQTEEPAADPEPATEPEPAAAPSATFAPSLLTVAGVDFPAVYTRSADDTISINLEMDGQRYSLTVPADHELHAAALAACEGETAQADEAAVVELCGQVEPAADPEPVKYYTLRRPPMPGGVPSGALEMGELERPRFVPNEGTARGWIVYPCKLTDEQIYEYELLPAADAPADLESKPEPKPERTPEQSAAKAAHGPVPDKYFIGQSFSGKGWKLVFDAEYDRTRVIFDRKPSRAALDAVKAAGFFWSPSMKSWNKGLTWKAFRAAEKLEQELHRICG